MAETDVGQKQIDIGKSISTQNEIDLNALDYEIDRDDNNDELTVNKKSESMALAFGVEIKSDSKAAESLKKGDKIGSKHRIDEHKLSDKRGGADKRNSRDRSRDRRNRSRERFDNRTVRRGRERSRSAEKNRRDRPRKSRDRSGRRSRYDAYVSILIRLH